MLCKPLLYERSQLNMVGYRDVYAIGKCKANWDGVRNVNVLVVREKAQVAKDNWSQFDSEATPDSSVTSD